ncbi:hypothetical protein [Rhizobium sp. SAFR-030]|uniref:hypothetical protein n=1 Tax=Rhizobium sp. SAFR-030 TaxID=3387277 RepID=UPI003F802AD7
MADFVAVIRRAVDGLASNTPEMRVRVYEKARGAVQRQLENMKPRPSDDMLRRQLEKLDAAIAEVEAEHAEALPPLDEAAAVPVADVYAAPQEPPAAAPPEYRAAEEPVEEQPLDEPVQPAAAEPLLERYDAAAEAGEVEPQADPQSDFYETAPAPAEDYPAYEAAPEPVAAEEPVYHEPAEEPETMRGEEPLPIGEDPWQPQAPEPAFADAPHTDGSPAEDVSVFAEPGGYEPASDASQSDLTADIDTRRSTSTYGAPAWPDAPSTTPVMAGDPFAEDDGRLDDEPVAANGQGADDWYMPSADVDHRGLDQPHNDSVPAADATADDWTLTNDQYGAPETRSSSDEAFFDDRLGGQDRASLDSGSSAELVSAHFDEEQHAAANAKMPPVSDLPDFGVEPSVAPVAAAVGAGAYARSASPEDDLLADYLQAPQPTAKIAPTPAAADDPWNDLEELIGYDRNAAAAGVVGANGGHGAPASAVDAQADKEELDALMAAPTAARAYRVTPKPKRNYAAILLAIVGLLLLAGGGYAIWMNRDALDQVVGEVTGPSGTETATAPASNTAAPATTTTTPNTTQPAAQPPATTPAQTAPAAGAAPAAAAATTKFTQRLLSNGTEVDDGAGGPSAGAPGQSVAQLNAPPADGAAAPAAGPVTAPAAAATDAAPQQVPSANPADAAAVTGEKIFLYEERIGQSSPTAVEGSVSWSLQKENGENGRPESSVQGRISIPGRGMTALVTFKRNTDGSLPASHLVEFVFSLPKDFEGGAIDSVQRISMKQTEQDRGDALIAVPAKITPDFHMIALNDFPDARARNLELLRTRNWIDVPLIYNTGRRALLTLQKGPEGTTAFEEATREWQALSPPQGQ